MTFRLNLVISEAIGSQSNLWSLGVTFFKVTHNLGSLSSAPVPKLGISHVVLHWMTAPTNSGKWGSFPTSSATVGHFFYCLLWCWSLFCNYCICLFVFHNFKLWLRVAVGEHVLSFWNTLMNRHDLSKVMLWASSTW